MKDQDEFCSKVKQCEKAMYFLAFSIVRNEQDAADVTSEAILRAFVNINALKNDDLFKPWILKIVHNTAIELVRKNSKIIDIDELNDKAEQSKENDVETTIALRQAIENLKQPYRTVVILFYYENLSTAQIAKITGVSILNVRQQLSRARKQLKKVLKEDFFNE